MSLRAGGRNREMNQWAVSSVLLASSRERGWAQWNTHDALASGGTPCFYRCTYFYRTSQGEASTEGSKQTIWVPVSLNFGGRWRNPSSEGGGERHALLLGEQELLGPASSLPGNPEGVPDARFEQAAGLQSQYNLDPLLPTFCLPVGTR